MDIITIYGQWGASSLQGVEGGPLRSVGFPLRLLELFPTGCLGVHEDATCFGLALMLYLSGLVLPFGFGLREIINDHIWT